MGISDEGKHDILLIIVVALAILFIIGFDKSSETGNTALVVPIQQ